MSNRDKAMLECDKFHLWLRDKVQNVHYANNEKWQKHTLEFIKI